MNNKLKRLSQIENFFSKFLTQGNVSKNIFVGEDLPATISKDWEDMVLADCNSQNDWGSHTSGSVSIFLYARPSGGKQTKNVKVLNKLEETLDTIIEAQADQHYTITCVNWRDHGYDTVRNLHYQVVNLQVLVK